MALIAIEKATPAAWDRRRLPLNDVQSLAMPWALRLLPATEGARLRPHKRLAGLPTALRLALSAQAGGAGRIEVSDQATTILETLKDQRLRIPVVSVSNSISGKAPHGDLVIELPWNVVVHRDLLREVAAKTAPGERNLLQDPFAFAPPFGFSPIVVTDDRTARQAESQLLRSLRKPQDGWTSTYLNRYLSLFCTRYLVRTPLRPNQVSVGILTLGIAGALLASQGTYLSMLLGALLFQAQSVLDGCDGEMSRVTYRGSRLGEWLDTVGDDITNYGFFVGTAWGMYRATGSWAYLVAGGVIVLCGVLTSGIEYRYLWRIGSGDLLKYPLGIGKAPSSSDAEKGSLARLVDGISPLFKRDSFVFLTLLGAVAGLLGPFLFLFAAAGIGIFVAVIQAELRMARERQARRSG